MIKFKRGIDPKEAMTTGLVSSLEKYNIKLTHDIAGNVIFTKGDAFRDRIYAVWPPEELRALANYMEAYPDKLIPIQSKPMSPFPAPIMNSDQLNKIQTFLDKYDV